MIFFKKKSTRAHDGDFVFLNNNPEVIYLDNACMSLRPKIVTDKIVEYYNDYPACGGRSHHRFSERVGDGVREARDEVKKLINAAHSDEIIFTRNSTEGINILAAGLALKRGDEVVISDKEHNSNLIPWLRLAQEGGIKIKVVSTGEDGVFNLDIFKRALTRRTKVVSIVHRSNLDGVTNPVKGIINAAHNVGALVILDAAQSIPSIGVDVRALNCDFLVFSGHKMCGPSGVGVLYGRRVLLNDLRPYNLGGETVIDSTYASYNLKPVPERFEAGLQDYSGIIGLGEAVRYIQNVGFSKIMEVEERLNSLVTNGLSEEISSGKIKVLGPRDSKLRGGIFSFIIKGVDSHNAARMLNASGIMVRSGAHCCHAWFNKNNLEGSVRASFYFYNTQGDAQKFVEGVKKIITLVG